MNNLGSPDSKSLASETSSDAPESLQHGFSCSEFAAYAVFWIRSDGEIEYANQKACDSLGYERTELVEMTVFDFDPGYPRSMWPGQWQKAKSAGQLKTDSVHHRKDGSTFPVTINSTFVDIDGIEVLCSSAIDVTEIKQRETEMRRQKEEIQSILDALPALVWFKDTNNRILKVSRSVAELSGLAIHEIEGCHVRELFPDDADEFYRQDLEVIESRQRKLGTVELLSLGSGPQRWYRTDKIPTFNDQGEVSGIIVVSTDVTQMKEKIDELVRSEDALQEVHRDLEQRFDEKTEQLRRSESKYQDLYHQSPEMHASVDPRTRKIVECNDTLANTLGYTKSELIATDLFDLYHSDCRETATLALREFMRSGEVPETELILRRKDGSPLNVSLRVTSVRDEQGRVLFSRSSWRDITQRKSAETLLKQREEELAHVSRLATMGEMAAGIAHELNQPLYSIANYARGCVLRMDSEAIDLDQMREIAVEVASEAERAGEIIRRLRRMVQKREPLKAELDVNLVIRDACQLLGAELRRHSVDIEFGLDASNPKSCSDDIQLQQVIVNLVRNAVEAMKNTPVEQRTVCVSSAVSDGEVCVTIADNGSGFVEGEQERIFDAFHTTSETGMGMGLAISRSIVEQHDGRIWATATPSGGATFRFTLPLLMKDATP